MGDPPAQDAGRVRADPDNGSFSRDETVRRSVDYCHRVTRERARNFYYGLKLTPEPKRSALYVVYAFMRICDDLADDPVDGGNGSEGAPTGLERIDRFGRQMSLVLGSDAAPDLPPDPPPDQLVASSSDGPVPAPEIWPGFREVMRVYPIQSSYLLDMLEGQRCDLREARYQTFEQLREYCYKVASVVGLVCISIWGYQGGEQTRRKAEDRGIALQLTNILRDVVEDARRDRVYLPEEDLQRFGFDRQTFTRQIISGEVDEKFDRLMEYQIERARHYYEISDDLDARIDPGCRPTSWAMMRIYRGLLGKIARDPRRVLTQRVRLRSTEKIGIAMKAVMRRGLCHS